MTRASNPRAARRAAKKKAPKDAAAAAKTADGGGNGQTAAAQPAAPQPAAAPQLPRTPVGAMKPAEVKKLADAENKLLKALAEIGDLTMQMEQARQRQLALAGEVQRMRQDFQAMMRGTVIAHGFDPDADKFNLNIESGQIERIG